MNEPREAKKSPEVKPWAGRVTEVAGVFMPENADGERRLGWWGVEMARFLKFCKTLREGTDLRSAMEGYGRYIKSSVPPPQDWQLDQTREALRCFQKGIENWHIAAPDAEGSCRRKSHEPDSAFLCPHSFTCGSSVGGKTEEWEQWNAETGSTSFLSTAVDPACQRVRFRLSMAGGSRLFSACA